MLNRNNAVTIVCAMILVGTEIFAIAVAAGWAIAGIFELGDTVGYVLMLLFSVIGALMMWKLWQQAVAAEPIWERLRAGATRHDQ